ncbi:MAG TPA: hypothetical protein PLF40_23870 [Kofleriaceae bacterium]|nr:hypothetical protein [Kofleriaceae bacterium]
MTRHLLLAATLSMTACTAVEPSDSSVCTGKCDDATATAPALRCWIEADPQETSDFTARDTLICQAQANAAYTVSTVDAYTADNNVAGVLFDASNAGAAVTVIRFYRQAAYPLRVTVDLRSTLSRVNSTLPPSLATEFTIANAAAATAAAPVSLALPFRVGEVTLDSHLASGAVVFDYELDLAPFTTRTGDTTLHFQQSLDMREGDRRTVQLPKAAGPIGLNVAGVARELLGFGHFAISSTGVSAVAAATGATVATCATAAGSTDAMRSVSCRLATNPHVEFQNAQVKVGDAAGVALTADQEVVVGEFPAAEFPSQLVVTATPAAKGTGVLDPALTNRTLELAIALPAGVGATAAARLDIDFWAASVSCAAEFCFFDRATLVLPVAGRWTWGFAVTANAIVDLTQDERADYVFASAAGQASFAGTTTVLVNGRPITGAATLTAGSFTMDNTGLHPAP